MENNIDEELMTKKKYDLSYIDDIKKNSANLLMKDNDEISAIAKESETDQQSPEFDGTNYDSMEDISFDKKDTTHKFWEIDKTISSEDAWECQIMRKKKLLK